MSDTLRDAGSSSIFWFALAIIFVFAIAGYVVSRRGYIRPSSSVDGGKVLHDRTPTGRIDFAGPSMEATAADTPASFYLQVEDIRFLVSLSGIERKEIRWRKATLNEAKRVVHIFHRQVANCSDGNADKAPSTPLPSSGGGAENMVTIRD